MRINYTPALYTIIALALFSGCGSLKSSQSKENLMAAKKKIYVQLYSVRDDVQKDFSGTLEKIAQIGFTGIEAANYNDGKFYGLSPSKFKSAIEKNKMEALSSHVVKALEPEISKTNWNETWKWWDKCIADHKAAGMKYIVMPWMPTPKTLSELKAYCDYYNQIGERCNKAGIRFGYHNHNFEFIEIDGQRMYDYMLQNTDPSKVFFQMDVYWTVRGGQSPVAYFQKYPGRFEILHIKDHKELGQSGMVGFDAIFNNADKAGLKYIMVEVEEYNFPPIESVRRSYDYLTTLKEVKYSY